MTIERYRNVSDNFQTEVDYYLQIKAIPSEICCTTLYPIKIYWHYSFNLREQGKAILPVGIEDPVTEAKTIYYL